uniref:Uncharacterized protein n=1 Tax=Melicertus latisulcatus pemonivirus TaxID=2984278 RepID=A0A9C7BW33_9VIRU|nr:MAG: hypothetical protein [Melicertus latisulcatus pemonivirus]
MNSSNSDINRDLRSSATPVASALYSRRCISNIRQSKQPPPRKLLTKFVFDTVACDSEMGSTSRRALEESTRPFEGGSDQLNRQVIKTSKEPSAAGGDPLELDSSLRSSRAFVTGVEQIVGIEDIPREEEEGKDDLSLVKERGFELKMREEDRAETSSSSSSSSVMSDMRASHRASPKGLDRLVRQTRLSEYESKITQEQGELGIDANHLEEPAGGALAEFPGGGVQPETNRHVRSSRTFVPGPDQVNGIIDDFKEEDFIPYSDSHVPEGDNEMTTHPLEMTNPFSQ